MQQPLKTKISVPSHVNLDEQVYFSDEWNLESIIINLIQSAKKSIRICMNHFNNPNILQALYHKIIFTNVKVKIIVNAYLQEDQETKITLSFMNYLYQAILSQKDSEQINIFTQTDNLLPQQFMVVDSGKLIYGTYKFTAGTEYNFENLDLTKQYNKVDKFKIIFDELCYNLNQKQQNLKNEQNQLKSILLPDMKWTPDIIPQNILDKILFNKNSGDEESIQTIVKQLESMQKSQDKMMKDIKLLKEKANIIEVEDGE